MYVRTKNIKGHTYYYLVEGHRVNGKVMQKVIKYLGKEGWKSIKPTKFVGVGAGADPNDNKTQSKLRTRLIQGCKTLNCTVVYNLRQRGLAGLFVFTSTNADGLGQPTYKNRRIRLRKDAPFATFCHEFGHLIDYELREQGISFADEAANLPAIGQEMKAIAKDKYPEMYAWVEGWTEAGLRDAADARERQIYRAHKKFMTTYAETLVETFANVFALCLTDPTKAERLAPETTALIMEIVQRDPKVRDVLIKLEVWELGTTEAKSGET